MGRFNLLDEPWIKVIYKDTAITKEISIIEAFKDAPKIKALAGDTKAQDFAVMRVILAVLHTVFSRFDESGNSYDYIELDDNYKQTNILEYEDEIEDYCEDLYNTWYNLWNLKYFPGIVEIYLEKWRERFYLFHDKFPFFQVRKEDITEDKINRKNPSTILGKNINRLISESNNKKALFAYKYDANDNKEILSESEIARWIITFQGYCGLSDKVIFGKEKYKASKGWLFDLGGIYLEGDNLFETLMLNLVLVHPESEYQGKKQKPCWEYTSEENISKHMSESLIDNISEIYAVWARAIYIDPDLDVDKKFSMDIVKLPEIEHQNQFLEPMTIWRYNESGPNKDTFTPRKHQVNQSMWRSFGLITLSLAGDDDSGRNPQRKPLIMDWLNNIDYKYELNMKNSNIKINSISMRDDGNATSWVPIDEIQDSLNIKEEVLTDTKVDGWIEIINNVVNETKEVVEITFKRFISEIKEIRNISSNDFVNQYVESLYFRIDMPFRNWLTSIKFEDSKDKKVLEWREILRTIVLDEANRIFENSSNRDYRGITIDDKFKNVATAYNTFKYFLDRKLV